jgi:flavin reductase (DIM6/NTAB) family NADH-FMN oxidoreductase RutF
MEILKKSFGAKPLTGPFPVYIIGYNDDQEIPNLVAVSWAGMVCSEPPCVSISLRKIRHSYLSIMKNRAFTVNVPSLNQIDSADFTGSISGKKCKKFDLTGLSPKYFDGYNAPFVDEYPVNAICQLMHTIDLGTHTVFIGEIKEYLVNENALDDSGKPDIEKVNPFIYDINSRHYYSLGEKKSLAYNSKKIFIKEDIDE